MSEKKKEIKKKKSYLLVYATAYEAMLPIRQESPSNLVDEGAQRSENLLQGRFWLIDAQEAEVDFKYLLHERTVAVISAELRLRGEKNKQTNISAQKLQLWWSIIHHKYYTAYLKTHNEDAERVQDS